MKLWGGRFKNTEHKNDDFHSSIHFDKRLYKHDIYGSIAHAQMLAKCDVITKDESIMIVDGLMSIIKDIQENKIEFSVQAEDIHMNIETLLITRIGDVGKKLHTGRSRNDQVALDIRMYMKDEIIIIKDSLLALCETLLKKAQANLEAIMPGYTHLQKAQPITLAHHLMAYFEMFKRDTERLSDCFKRVDKMPLGSGALASTTYPLDRNMVSKQLGFSSITENSLDSVSDRDFIVEFSACGSIIMMHLSRFCEELILWSTDEFRFIELSESYSTGSSIMPQKKNPDMAELIRGKTGRVYGNLISILTVMKSLPLAYNKDMQEDKEGLFDTIDTLKNCITVFTGMIKTAEFKFDNMKKAASGGFTNATDAADYLVRKGIPFREAHEILGKLVLFCIDNNKDLTSLTIEEFKGFSDVIDKDIYEAIDIQTCVNARNLPGGPAPSCVRDEIHNGSLFITHQKNKNKG